MDELRALIGKARTAGADEDDCNFADKKVDVLATVVSTTEENAPKKAEGALGFLKNISEGFKSYSDIGESFEKILKLVAPALAILLNTPALGLLFAPV